MLNKNDKILAIESSCDDTSVAVLNLNGDIIYDNTMSQNITHAKYGGVVPELASRDHVINIQILLNEVYRTINIKEIAAVAVTQGPGMIGGLLVGMMCAKGLSMNLGVPLIGINHLEGHIMSGMINQQIEYPILTLLVSGGHSEIIIAEKFNTYHVLSKTLDDAAGEVLDKVAKMLGLGYPGGPVLEQIAMRSSNVDNFKFKTGIISKDSQNFSFSGLKTQIKRKIESIAEINDEIKAEIAFSTQQAVFNTLVHKLEKAMALFSTKYCGKNILICGGVASNLTFQEKISILCKKYNLNIYIPNRKYITDNAAMIARAGVEHYKIAKYSNLNITPKTKWPLNDI